MAGVDSYTQGIINKNQKDQRKEDDSSGIFLINDQQNKGANAEKGKTHKE